MDYFASVHVSSTIVILGVASLAVILYKLVLVFRNPLRSIPGPEYSKWTSVVLLYSLLKGRKPSYIHYLHQKYGPIVRIAPNEVDVSDISAAKEIHKVGAGYLKSEFYRRLPYKERETLFSSTDPKSHARLRKLLAAPISETSLRNVEPEILYRVQLTIQRIKEELEKTGEADIFKWWVFMATDVIGELTFGESFRMLEYGVKNQYIIDMQNVSRLIGLKALVPSIEKICEAVPLPVFKRMTAAGLRLQSYATQSIERYKKLVAEDPDNPRQTLFTKLFNAGKDGLTDQEIVSNAIGFISAGSDTTAVTLTYLVFAVCNDENVRRRLVEEVRPLPDTPTDQQVQSLPYLNQVINETLRRFIVAPSPLPRVVPPQGANLVGHHLPAGSVVSTQSYSLHRDADAFPDPERFDPSRWANPTPKMRNAFMPFGGGVRICIGQHLALIEIRLATALFFKKFPNVKVVSQEDMEPTMFFLLSPKGLRCMIREEVKS